MKYCPTCQTEYDEEILRFCTKDGTPLIDEDQPKFTKLPSEESAANDDYGEETVIRRKTPVAPPFDPDAEEYATRVEPDRSSQRIVIPTAEQERQNARPTTTVSSRQMPPPRESNTAIVVLLTIIGTVVVLTAAGGIFWALSDQKSNNSNQNINTNVNAFDGNINANMNDNNSLFDPNANFNSNTNSNSNIDVNFNSNVNANTKTPTPTPTPTPSPTPTPTPNEENTNNNVNANLSAPTPPRPSVSPKSSVSPRPSVSPTTPPANLPSNSPANAGIINDRAIRLQTPSYPQVAREMRASGRVQVLVSVDANGNVNSAKAVSGNPLLRQSAEDAARNSKFNPVRVSGENVETTGFVVYNFIQPN